MSKRTKLKKDTCQKDLTELWKTSMTNGDTGTNTTPKTNISLDKKKRTPASAEKPDTKRTNTSQNDINEDTMEPLHTGNPVITNMNGVNSGNHGDTKSDNNNPHIPETGTARVQLTPELQELHRLLNVDLGIKLDQKLDPLQSSVNEIKANLQIQETKIEHVMKIEHENIQLQARCLSIEKENLLLKKRLNVIENHLLENNIILQGITEYAWELNSVLKEKTIHTLANMIEAPTRQQQVDLMRDMPIRKVQRLGKFNSKRGRPISVSFTYKEDADYCYDNKSYLKKGIYLDREYSEETENNRRIL